METIKFRGKRIDNGEWVYGGIAYAEHLGIGFHIMETFQTAHQVIPESVGQFIGLLDSDGNEIYNGMYVTAEFDLGESQNHESMEISGHISYDEKKCAFYIKTKTGFQPIHEDSAMLISIKVIA